MGQDSGLGLGSRMVSEARSALDGILQEGARRMLQSAIENRRFFKGFGESPEAGGGCVR